MPDEPGFLPGERLWTPWRMAYVGGGEPSPGCVFCEALAGKVDASSLIVHRGEHAFAIMNLFPYNTGHVMIVPHSHERELAALSRKARAEMAELTASFCTGLRLAMNCDGFNTGMNLGSAAGAGIADHLHQHIVPRWVGDANFMPIVGGTKVLPELVTATYAKLRAEVARQKSGADSVTLILFAREHPGLYLVADDLPAIPLSPGVPAWKSAINALTPESAVCELLGWAGGASSDSDSVAPPCLALAFSPRPGVDSSFRRVAVGEAGSLLTETRYDWIRSAAGRLGIDLFEG